MQPLRIGLIGAGVVTRYYLTAITDSPELELVAACDLREERLAGLPPGVLKTDDYWDLLDRPGVDAVVINVPNDTHFEIAFAALLADKHVCCEKPLTTEVAQAELLSRTAREHGLTLFTALHRRYNQNFTDAFAGLRRADVAGVTARYLEKIEEHAGEDAWYLDPARCGGGAVADNGPNAFDLVEVLVGPTQVSAARLEHNAAGVDLYGLVQLESEDGTPVQVELDWAYGQGELKDVTVRLRDGRRIHVDLLAGYQGFKDSLWHEYDRVIHDFAAAVRGERPEVPDGLSAVRLVSDTYAIAEAVGSAQ